MKNLNLKMKAYFNETLFDPNSQVEMNTYRFSST